MPRAPSGQRPNGGCDKCGQHHERCAGHVRRCIIDDASFGKSRKTCPKCGGTEWALKPCMKHPIRGGTVCAGTHGGNAPQVRAAAQRNLAEKAARRSIAGVVVQPITNPFAEFEDLIGYTRTLRDVLAEHVADLQGEDGDGLRYQSSGGTEQLRSEVDLWMRSLRELGRLLESYIRLDIENRRLRLDERLVRQLESALRATFEAHGLGNDDAAMATFATALRVIDGGAAA